MKPETPRPVRLKDYRPSPYLIRAVDLDVALDPTDTRVRARLSVSPNPAVETHGPLKLDGEHLTLEEVAIDGRRLAATDYDVTDRQLVLPRTPGRAFTLDITTRTNPEANTALQGLYLSRGIFTTQCEAEGFRRITYFLDRPDVLATYRTRLEAEAERASVLLSNGNLVERGTLARGKRHYAVWADPHPKPCYLFAVVGGHLASVSAPFTTVSGRKVDLGIYVEPGKESRCAWALDALKRSMRWDEIAFGREYDLDVFNIVAVSDFNMGAMENKGLNIFNDKLILASPDTATDAMFEAIEAVVAHEYFHNWTGNRITCRDWFQLCLKEGLTVYRDQEFSADERSRAVQRIGDVRQLKAIQFPEDSGPLAHPVRPESYMEINNFYTATVYEKGAELVRMIRTITGADGFRAGMDHYFSTFDGTAATVEDFLGSFETATGRDLGQFRRWYTQAGTPQVIAALRYDRARRTAELELEQVQPATPDGAAKRPLHVPVRLGLVGSDGRDLPLRLDTGETLADGTVHLTREAQTFRFVDIAERPVPSLLRGFSAPVRLTIDLTDRDLAFLMARDPDPFNRWQAGYDFALRTLVQAVRARDTAWPSPRAAAFVEALATAIAEPGLEPAYRAELLRLPGETDIAREIGRNVDPGRINRARRQLARLIGTKLGRPLEAIYHDGGERGPYSPDAASAGRRALRTIALALLAARNRKEDRARVVEHYRRAGNMTDRAAALSLLASGSDPARQAALDDFYKRHHDDHVVIDTWFSVQAMSPQAGTLAQVKALMRHPLFSRRAPNKVRALIGAFALGNPVQFNRPDGAGYKLVADEVAALDRHNPQVAARLLSAFRSWRSLERERRGLAKAALKRLAARDGLSRDVTEIVTKILA